MKVGFLGLGKLGLPCALAVEAAGHEVKGFDPSPEVERILVSKSLPYHEDQAQELLNVSRIVMETPNELAEWADLIFVAVQTPHQPEYEGITRLPETRADFDYDYLCQALVSVDDAQCPVVVISTVLPGTLASLGATHVLYNPFFIAMGTTIPDFRDPEFVLIGTDLAHPGPLKELYASIHSKPILVTTIKSAELTKVLYNTFIGLKIAFANTVMELAEKTGADCDEVIDALSLADKRIISSMYMRGGMGDGGGCHPRDNIALSWLARELDLSYDIFNAIMECREKQTEWLMEFVEESGSVIIQGKAYKPETNLTVGSPALLLSSLLSERGIPFEQTDPYI